jgi:hypothetical protein
MAEMSGFDAHIADRIATLLGDLGGSWSVLEEAEVERFLRAGEYGLALDTLSWIIVEGRKPIADDALRDIVSLADVMDLGKAPFVKALQTAHERQTAQRDPAF